MSFKLISSFSNDRYRPASAHIDDKSYLRMIPVDVCVQLLCHIYDDFHTKLKTRPTRQLVGSFS